MQERNRKLLYVLLVVLFLCSIAIQSSLNPTYMKMLKAGENKGASKSGDIMAQLPGQFIFASFTGFRQVIAGALWIRADDFFHRGQYQAIVPIVRIVTWLDPHNIDVFTTGAWHLDYNFVDEANSLSDKRYIPAAIALMKEGIANNPTIWDLYFELGWTHYSRKLLDDAKATEYIAKACKYGSLDANTGQKQPRPEFVDRMLAHSYEKLGRLDDAIKQWRICRVSTVRGIAMNKKKPGSAGTTDTSSLEICDRNMALLLLRMGWRYGRMDCYEEGLKIAESMKTPRDWVEATQSARKDFESRKGTNWGGDTARPIDTKFEVSWMRAAPQVLLIRGKANLVPASEYKGLASESFTHWFAQNEAAQGPIHKAWRDGCRVYWRLQDYDYKTEELESFSWKIDTSKTAAWGDIYVSGGSFSTNINMGDARDREMYPFTADKYKLTIWMSPVEPGMPDYVQDRVGWKGEAITDKNYLDLTTRPGFRMLKREFILKRSDII